jgi:hypothetical protein
LKPQREFQIRCIIQTEAVCSRESFCGTPGMVVHFVVCRNRQFR